MNKTLICCLVEQYLLNMKEVTCNPPDVYSAARAGGNHNRVNLMTKNYRGISINPRMGFYKDTN